MRDCRGYCSRHMGCAGGWREAREEKGPSGRSTPRQGESFLSTYCSLSFTARIFEQKLTVRRNPLLAPLHFQLLFYSLFSHLGPSYLHNEKRFGGEKEQVSIVMACLVSLYCKKQLVSHAAVLGNILLISVIILFSPNLAAEFLEE